MFGTFLAQGYAIVRPYRPDIVWWYVHRVVDILGWISLTGLPVVGVYKLWAKLGLDKKEIGR